MGRKTTLRVGRTKCRVNIYFWWSETTEARVGFFFPSRKAANSWREQAFWKYAKYPVLDHFLATVPKTMWPREKVWWMRHRDYYMDITLETGAVSYVGKKFHDLRTNYYKDKEKDK